MRQPQKLGRGEAEKVSLRVEREPDGLCGEGGAFEEHDGTLKRKARGTRCGPKRRTLGRSGQLLPIDAALGGNQTDNGSVFTLESTGAQPQSGRGFRAGKNLLEAPFGPGGPQERRDALDRIRPHGAKRYARNQSPQFDVTDLTIDSRRETMHERA